MLVNSKKLLLKAYKRKYAIGAFNTCNLEITKAIITAAKELKSPVIISTSENEVNYAGVNYIASILKVSKEKIPIALHLDHGKSLKLVQECIKAGYTSVHIDGSSLPFKRNVKITRGAARIAHRLGISVEGELGRVMGSSTVHKTVKTRKKDLTDPIMAREFVKLTGVDVLAVSIGNIHGISPKRPKLDFERLKTLNELKIPLALHGGSGIGKKDIKRAVKLGIAKVNVNTELRLAFVNALRRELKKKEIVPYKILPYAIDSVKNVVKEKIRLFGSVGKI